MEQMMMFLQTFGWQLALIALIGIVALGFLKYTNAFSKVEKAKRKPIYFAITIGFSFIATIIYLVIIKQFEFNYLITITAAIYALNQTMYAVYETTNLRDLFSKLINFVNKKVTENNNN